MPRVLAALLATVLLAPAAIADDTAPTREPPDAEALIARLGGASFADRERAARELVELGSVVLPQLRAVVDSPDLEIRYRSRRVLDVIREREHESRLQAFLDAEDLDDDALPGWGRYRDEVGASEEAKKLFVEMQRGERRLFEMFAAVRAESEPSKSMTTELAGAYSKRCIELQYRYSYGGAQRVPMGNLAAVLFLAGEEQLTMDATTKSRVGSFCNYNDFRSQLTTGIRVPLARSILGCWIGRDDEDDLNQLYARARLALQYDVQRGLVPAMKLLDRKQMDYRAQYALLVLGKFGGAEELKVVEGLMEDQTVLSRSQVKGKPTYTCEVRDVALAVALHMTQQETDDYGFARLRPQTQYLYMPNSQGFEDPEKREAAFEKYKASRGE